MIRNLLIYPFLFYSAVLLLFSCGSAKSNATLYDPREVAEVSQKLGIHLNNKDKEDDANIPLYAEVSLWMGAPYRYGGMGKHGTDCSGFTMQVYKKIYRKKLPRSTAGLAKAKYPKVAKRNLKTGDLILFATGRNKKEVTHVGIYLKDNMFIHASTSRGVIVSNLDEDYYKRAWIRAIRVK